MISWRSQETSRPRLASHLSPSQLCKPPYGTSRRYIIRSPIGLQGPHHPRSRQQIPLRSWVLVWVPLTSKGLRPIRKRKTKLSTQFPTTLLFALETTLVLKALRWTNCSTRSPVTGMERRMALWLKRRTSLGSSKPGDPRLHSPPRLRHRIPRQSGRRILHTGSPWSFGMSTRSKRRVASIHIPFGTPGVCTTSTSRLCARKAFNSGYTFTASPRSTQYPRLLLQPAACCHHSRPLEVTSSLGPPRLPLSHALLP